MLPVAILAGGLATRLRPLTETVPKSMVTVGGKPFIEHQLKELARQGIKKIILCTGYLGNMIENFVESGSEFGMEVSYSRETNQLLGKHVIGSLTKVCNNVKVGDKCSQDIEASTCIAVQDKQYKLMCCSDGKWADNMCNSKMLVYEYSPHSPPPKDS